MKKIKIKLLEFETELFTNFIRTKLTYETPFGIAKIIVNASNKSMSTANFIFRQMDKVTDEQYGRMDLTIRNEAINFIEKLVKLLNIEG